MIELDLKFNVLAINSALRHHRRIIGFSRYVKNLVSVDLSQVANEKYGALDLDSYNSDPADLNN